jgi:tRNA pseudouridine32 synthase / 23S rRNA pseudouridine746 synthase
LHFSAFPDTPDAMNTEEMIARILYRDALMLVIDKPAGLPVHPGPKGGETLTHHLDALRFGLPRKPEAAHRLDKETSGCLILGRHAKALATLNELFRKGHIKKRYMALVEGSPLEEEGLIDMPLAKRSPLRGWWMKPDEKGLPAQTRWFVKERRGLKTLLELEPLTGRTHQLRVHCAAMELPIYGDPIYGTGPRFKGPGLHLHAWHVTVPLYPKKEPLLIEAPLPQWVYST